MATNSFGRFAGLSSVLAAFAGLLYSVAFVILQNNLLSALLLLLGGLFATAALVALFDRLGEVDSAMALWGLLLGVFSALGAAIHGGYDLANAIHPPADVPPGFADLPSAVDPRGLLTFGVAGVAFLIAGYMLRRSHYFDRRLGFVAYLLGALLIVVYLGRLIVLTPTSPLILVPAALTGFIVNPLFYLWLGLELRRLYAGPGLNLAQANKS